MPIQPSVVLCSCSRPSMVRNHPDSCSPLAIPGASSCHCPSMEGPSSEARVDGASGSETQQAAQAPQPRKKKPEDFKFGKILGEGSFSTVPASDLPHRPPTSRRNACNVSVFVLRLSWRESRRRAKSMQVSPLCVYVCVKYVLFLML